MSKKNLRRVNITVTAQTLYHLKNMANACGHRDVGRVVDKLVRERQTAARNLYHDTTDQAELVTRARQYLQGMDLPPHEIKIDAMDLRLLEQAERLEKKPKRR